ncbi:MAG: hybrid sensor histidine kinase/response regulator [Methylobacteriaceae bacterium]|nr:hybrid sensor histidine kinase/response regulator [Methylobacteriaceae bacterium]
MIPSWAAVLTALVYLCLLFAVAHWGDMSGRRLMGRRWRPTIYALALAVYCTSWTFYGSVGLATRAGLDFLAIYVGPILVFGLGYPAVARIIRIAKSQNSTSVADFIAARYGKSERVAAIVCVISVVGSLPYIALQLKAVSSSLAVFLGSEGARLAAGVPLFSDLALLVALVLAGFAVAFGTRYADATEHQDGLVLAVAVESVVKLAAFLAIGLFVTYATFNGFSDIVGRLSGKAHVLEALGPSSDPVTFLTMTVLAAFMALLLPRQFHMAVVENRAAGDLKRAAWLFPLYLVAINVFVLPLALAGLHMFPTGDVDRDMTVLLLPLSGGSWFAALVAFVGGLSAAFAMVIVDTVAVSIMVSNHLVMPLVLRRRGFPHARAAGKPSLGRLVLATRRLSILALTLLGYLYFRFAGVEELASIGLLSFAAIAQIAPAFFGGLVWRRGTALGATAGLTIGILAWAYTLLAPTLLDDLGLQSVLTDGPFGLAALRPTALAGMELPQLAHGVVWSLGLNLAAYVIFSLLRPASALERLQASVFVGETAMPISPTLRFLRASVTIQELGDAVARFLGEERTRLSFEGFARSRGTVLDPNREADIHILRYAEHLLASAIGAASSRHALSLVLRRRNLSGRAALRLLDEASAALQHNRDILQHALDHAQQGITVFDKDLRLLGWNQAFIELYEFPPESVRIGVGLDEIVRVNAERGTYGPGVVDELMAGRLHSMLHDPGPARVRIYPSGRVISVRANHLPGGGLVATYTDVTELAAEEEERTREHETLEQRVRERTEELTRLNEELSRAKAEADEANASKTRFLAAASHDILQPLNAARLYATSLVERAKGTEPAQLAENIDASLDAVEEILTTLLDISRLDTGALPPQWSTVRLDDLFRQLEREFSPIAREKRLELTFVGTSLSVRTDRGMLRRLLLNLVSNAIKYTPSGRVLVGVRRRGGAARIEVLDTGLGIPRSQQKAIFREFRRLSEGAKTADGLGLGLSIVERLAKALDIRIGLESEPGRGSVFSVTVPTALPEPEKPVKAAPRTVRGGAPLRGLAVLAIDNEPAILDGMRTMLTGWGCEVATAASLRDALDSLSNGVRPQVIVADYHLDDGDGLNAITAVETYLGYELPAVLVTADTSAFVKVEAAERQIPLLPKPVRPAALRAVLSQARVARAEAAE